MIINNLAKYLLRMITPEQDIILKKFWNEISHIKKLNLLSENHFWDGLSVYGYEYLPNDLKEVLLRIIEQKR